MVPETTLGQKTIELSQLPTMLRQLIGEKIANTPSLVVFEIDTANEAIPDAIVLEGADQQTALAHLKQYPQSSIVAVSAKADTFNTYELVVCERQYKDISMAKFIEGVQGSLENRLVCYRHRTTTYELDDGLQTSDVIDKTRN